MKKVSVIRRKVITGLIGYILVVSYVILHSVTNYSIVALGAALLFFAITGEYGGRLVHGAANAALLKKLQQSRP